MSKIKHTNCLECGKVLSGYQSEFCSRSCANRHRPRRQKQVRYCLKCSAPLTLGFKGKFCDGCRYMKPEDKKPMRLVIQDFRHRRKAECLEYLGGKCVRCGSIEALEFDHINPSEKSFTISNELCLSMERLIPELNKCQLLCNPCHIAKTREDLDTGALVLAPHNKIDNPEHGTAVMYDREKCKCDICREWKRRYRNKEVDSLGRVR